MHQGETHETADKTTNITAINLDGGPAHLVDRAGWRVARLRSFRIVAAAAEQAVYHRAELRKVLLVVEHRTKNEKVREKMRDKLSAMSDRQLRLAASLCERIAHDDDSVRSDIAFSIVAALIVLS